MAENFPNLGEDIHLQVQEPQETPNRINTYKIMTRHIIIKLMKTKNKKKGWYKIVTIKPQ